MNLEVLFFYIFISTKEFLLSRINKEGSGFSKAA